MAAAYGIGRKGICYKRGKEDNIGLSEGGLKRDEDHGRGVRARERKIVNMVKFSARNEQGTRDKEKVA